MIEIRCPACIPLGFSAARLILTVYGEMIASDVWIQFHCHRCKSDVKWGYGTQEFIVIKEGIKNHKPMKASFE